MNQARPSYPALVFDRCDACSDVALDAIIQSALFVLARVVPSVVEPALGPVEARYHLRATLCEDDGREIASDEVDVEQSIGLGDANADDADDVAAHAASPEPRQEAPDSDEVPPAHASLDDFQALVDRVELRPNEPYEGFSGVIAGSLFGFERLIGPFEVLVGPGR